MKQQTPEDLLEIARVLEANRVKWVLVGGMALVIHGGTTLTSDADFAVEKTLENLNALKIAFESIRARPLRAKDEGDFELDNSILLAPFMHMKSDHGDIDLINRLPGIDSFDGLYRRAIVLNIEGVNVRVASIDDLIRMKRVSDRPKDQLHLVELQSLKDLTDSTSE